MGIILSGISLPLAISNYFQAARSGDSVDKAFAELDVILSVANFGLVRFAGARIAIAASASPEIFYNLYPGDYPPTTPIPISRAQQITQRLLYVVDQDGNLIVTKDSNVIGAPGHSNLVGGEPVVAAGTATVVKGKVIYIDNASGHYQPYGVFARDAALNAFRNNGFEVSDSAYHPVTP